MSVNLRIRFEIHNIKEIHFPRDEVKRKAILTAAKDFFTEENIYRHGDMDMDFCGEDGYLSAYTNNTVTVRRSSLWVEYMTKRWTEIAHGILGPSCVPKVFAEFPDDDFL